MKKWNGPPHEPQFMCGAHARSTGKPCRRFAMANGRCDMHGGKSTGAKNPNRPIKHGMRTSEAIKECKLVKELLRKPVD